MQLAASSLLLTTVSSLLPSAQQTDGGLFVRHELATGQAVHQTVLPGSFLGGDVAEIAVASVEKGGARLRLFAFGDETWTLRLEAELRPDTLFVDVARIGERDRLITYEDGGVYAFDPESGAQQRLVSVDFDYTAPRAGGIPYADVTRDVNADGRDDLVVPGFDGFVMFLQRSDGTFADPVQLGPPEPHVGDKAIVDDFTYGEMGINPISIAWYQGRVHGLDYDQDGRRDLAFWNEDRFDVHLQEAGGTFAAEARTARTGVAIDSDGEYSLQYGFRFEDSSQTALRFLGDLNGDGVADLVTMSLTGPGLFKQTIYGVHFGQATPDGVTFSSDSDTEIAWPTILSGMQAHDLDGDGRQELKFSAFRPHPDDVDLAALYQAESVSYDLAFYRLEDGAYPEEPSAMREVTSTRDFSPPVLIGDVNGDGLADLLIGRSSEELHVFLGEKGPDLFAAQPRKLALALPSDEEYSIDYPYRPSRLVDLNGDGKQDLLVHRASTTGPHRVTVLIAR